MFALFDDLLLVVAAFFAVSHVVLHLEELHEAQSAIQALKVLLVVVAFFVIFSVTVRYKFLLTKLAAIRLLTGVYAHVMDEACPVFQHFQTLRHWTLIV